MILALSGVSLTIAWAAPLTADDVVRYAIEHHADVIAAQGEVGIATGQRRDAAVFLANPQGEASVAVEGDLVDLRLTQPLSITGEGWSARRGASRAEDAARADEQRSRYVVAARARAAYVQASAADERARLADEGLAQANRLRAALEERGAAGEVSSLDVRLGRLAEVRATATAIDAHRSAASARTALVVFHPASATAELVDSIELAAPEPRSAGERSDLLAAAARVEAAHSGLTRARASTVPLLGVGVFFEQDGGDRDIGPLVTVELPLWARSRESVAVARADLATAEAEAEALRAAAAAEIAGTARTAALADTLLSGVGGVGDDAREALASVRRALESGDLGVAQAVLLRTEILDGWTASVDARESGALARLDALLAVESPNLLPASTEGP